MKVAKVTFYVNRQGAKAPGDDNVCVKPDRCQARFAQEPEKMGKTKPAGNVDSGSGVPEGSTKLRNRTGVL
jgi:hypothetical protein